MKDDLIKRQDVLDALIQIRDAVELLDKAVVIMAIGEIKNIPFAEPEREKGKWQRRKDEDCWECSECHAVLENSDIGNHNFYYCYHCGADMMDICGYMDLEKANYE